MPRHPTDPGWPGSPCKARPRSALQPPQGRWDGACPPRGYWGCWGALLVRFNTLLQFLPPATTMILTKCGVFRCKLDQGMNGKDEAPLWAAAAPLPEIPCVSKPWDSPWDQQGRGDPLSHLLPAAGERKTPFFTLILSFIPNPPFSSHHFPRSFTSAA